MLPADTVLYPFLHRATLADGHFHKATDGTYIEGDERVAVDEFLLEVARNEFTRIVAGEAIGHLGQVVGAEAHEFHFGSEAVRAQCRPGCFHHGADFVRNGKRFFAKHLADALVDDVGDQTYLADVDDQGNHDLR